MTTEEIGTTAHTAQEAVADKHTERLHKRYLQALTELEAFVDASCTYALDDDGRFHQQRLTRDHNAVFVRLAKRVNGFASRIGQRQWNSQYWNNPNDNMKRRQRSAVDTFRINKGPTA